VTGSTWTLTGRYDGKTPWTIYNGTLVTSEDANLGNAAGTLTFAEDKANTGASRVWQVTSGFTSSRNVVLEASGAIDTQNHSLVLDGNVSGTRNGSLTKVGSGSLTLTSKNSLTVKTTVPQGDLRLRGEGSIAQSAKLELHGGFDITGIKAAGTSIIALGGDDKAQTKLGKKDLTLSAADGSEFAGVISGEGSVIIAGGKQSFSGINTYTGNTSIRPKGELELGNESHEGSLKSAVVVEGILSGSGSVMSVTNTGMLAPGTEANFGSLNVNGD